MLNDKLKERKIEWGSKIIGYKDDALEEITNYNLRYRKEIKMYPYNDSIKDFILENEKIDSDLIDYLKTEVYLSQQTITRRKDKEYEEKMLKNGYKKLTIEVIEEAKKDNKNIQLVAKTTSDFLSFKVDKVYKPYITSHSFGLMDLKARTRGYNFYHFEDAYCKLI